ncbi:MAG: hypothetical protein H7X92_02300 [Chitinophagales bacterium]|nr:hypothetical protein [Hyphomicrobiales bacterium]
MAVARPVVVKLGGSLWNNANLKYWLAAICDVGAPIAVAPGGGPFADAVRAAQPVMDFPDDAAHRMALLAMAQYAHALCGLNSRFVIAETPDDFDEAWVRRLTPVWSPHAMAAHRGDIPQTWDVTSDSLAALLAGAIDAKRLIIVKSVAAKASETLRTLADKGVVDPYFPDFAERACADCIVLSDQESELLSIAVKGGDIGYRLVYRAP